MYVKSIWSNMLFKYNVSLLIFCLDIIYLSANENAVLKSPTINVLLSFSPLVR